MPSWVFDFVPALFAAVGGALIGIWYARSPRKGAASAAPAAHAAPVGASPQAARLAPTAGAAQRHGEAAGSAPEPPRAVGGDSRVRRSEADVARMLEMEEELRRHSIEYGRLEAGAVAAIDEVVRLGRERELALVAELETARTALVTANDGRELLSRRVASLQSSLAERDERIAALHDRLSNV